MTQTEQQKAAKKFSFYIYYTETEILQAQLLEK